MTTSHRTLALSLGGAIAVAAAASAFPLFHGRIAPALDALGEASRPWLTLSAAAFFCAFVCTVGAWRAAFQSSGARLCPRQAAARLGVGAMVNSFAPAKLGDAVKVTLCARAIDAPGRLWTASGAYAALTAARSLTLAALVVAASATHAMPVWPVFVFVGGAGVLTLAAAASSRFRGHHRIARFLDGVTALARNRRALLAVASWTVGMQVARVVGAVAIAFAFGLPHPVLAALVILPALDVVGAIPLTPGSIGVGSGAVAVVLASRGIGMTQALAAGLAIQGVETVVSIVCGSLGLAYLVRENARIRVVAARVALVGASAALAAVVGVAVLDLL
ncbi:MAG: lysylphosphatidylglycerol synthase transmembrane domain-containing protein [Gaiellaceae bacterium]